MKQSKPKEEDVKLLALTAKIEKLIKNYSNNSGNSTNSSNHFNNSNFQNKWKSWRFQTKNKIIGIKGMTELTLYVKTFTTLKVMVSKKRLQEQG